MNWRAIRAMMRKDLQQVRQNKMIWLPMILVPAILNVFMPLMMVLLPSFFEPESFGNSDLDGMLRTVPGDVRAILGALTSEEQWIYLSANVMFAPMFLIVPIMVSSILAADSVVGERERKTLEALLYTPMTDGEIFVSKVLYSFVPACLVSIGSFLVNGVVVNIAGYRIMGRIFFPTASWWPMVFWLGPAVSVIGLGATVLISSKVKTFMQAQQASGLLVLPIVFLMIAQISGLFFLSMWLTIIIGFFAWLIGIWLVWVGARTFSRGELVARV
jgi:ABC-type transport system involved in multi-copper enzyme maturation permease subunit